MFGIPFLPQYIKKIVKVQSVADSVDWLNYYCSSLMLAFFSLAISAKQYFGTPINCWTPNEFKGGWDRYAEDYCFIANSYYVPFDEEVPTDLALREDRISYYRWVPIMLAVQALLFWLPNWLWNMLHKQTAVNPRAVINEALPLHKVHGLEREKAVSHLALYITDALSIFTPPKKSWFQCQLLRSGYCATFLYLAVKLLYVLNVVGQLALLNHFLGGNYHLWSLSMARALFNGQEWPEESSLFPRVIMCDFTVRRLANPQRHTVQCVMMLNMINEKLYFFLHIWLLLVGAVTAVNFAYYAMVLTTPFSRRQFVTRNVNKQELKRRGLTTREMARFVEGTLRADGVLLLQFVRQHVGGRLTYELLNELVLIYWYKRQRVISEVGGGTAPLRWGDAEDDDCCYCDDDALGEVDRRGGGGGRGGGGTDSSDRGKGSAATSPRGGPTGKDGGKGNVGGPRYEDYPMRKQAHGDSAFGSPTGRHPLHQLPLGNSSLGNSFHNGMGGFVDGDGSAPPTYKATLYGPAGLYPLGQHGDSSPFRGGGGRANTPTIQMSIDDEEETGGGMGGGRSSGTPTATSNSQASTLPLKELRIAKGGNGGNGSGLYVPGPHSPRTPNNGRNGCSSPLAHRQHHLLSASPRLMVGNGSPMAAAAAQREGSPITSRSPSIAFNPLHHQTHHPPPPPLDSSPSAAHRHSLVIDGNGQGPPKVVTTNNSRAMLGGQQQQQQSGASGSSASDV